VLQDGRVAEQGSHEQLIAISGGVYKRLWDAQLTENTQVNQDEADEVEVKGGGVCEAGEAGQ